MKISVLVQVEAVKDGQARALTRFAVAGRGAGASAAVTAGFRPALWSSVVFAALATVTAIAIPAHTPQPATDPADVLVAA